MPNFTLCGMENVTCSLQSTFIQGSQLISHLPLQLDGVSKTRLSVAIEQKFYNPLGTLASKVTHAVLRARPVFAVFLLTGQDET